MSHICNRRSKYPYGLAKEAQEGARPRNENIA